MKYRTKQSSQKMTCKLKCLLRFHLIPVRIAKIKKKEGKKKKVTTNAGMDVGKKEIHY